LPFDTQTCIDPLAVILEDESFFEGLRRIRGNSALGWRYLRDGQTVERFPNSLSIEVRAVPSYCPQRRAFPPWPLWNDKLVEFMGALRFKLQWLEGSKFTPAEIDSLRTSTFPAEGAAWPRWSYCVEIWSVGIPITDDLSVEVLSPDGQRLVRMIGGMDRADPFD
jgi:hypothetical protein